MARSKVKAVCPHCRGTGCVLTWEIEHPAIILCTYCGGSGAAQGD